MKCNAFIPAFLFSLIAFSCCAKDFTRYYTLINQAEEEFVMNNSKRSLDLYNKAFREYDKPFVKDCYIATQIAYSLGDTVNFYKYVALAFRNGMPLTAYPAAPILRASYTDVITNKRITELYEQNKGYFSIDTVATDKIHLLCYAKDSMRKIMTRIVNGKPFDDTVLMLKNIELEEKIIKYIDDNYLRKGVLPSEKILGINSEELRADFLLRHNKAGHYDKTELNAVGNVTKLEYDFFNNTIFSVFIHSTCTWQDYNDKLWKCVMNGYLTPKDYGLLHETSATWNRSNTIHKLRKICDYPQQDSYYNILAFNPTHQQQSYTSNPELIKEVEKTRAKYFMQKFSVDQQKKKLEKEQGFKFFTGFSKAR